MMACTLATRGQVASMIWQPAAFNCSFSWGGMPWARMTTRQPGSGRPFFKIADAALLQQLQHLGIVDQRPIGIDFAGLLVDGAQHQFHGSFHTHAEARGAGQDNFQGRDSPADDLSV